MNEERIKDFIYKIDYIKIINNIINYFEEGINELKEDINKLDKFIDIKEEDIEDINLKDIKNIKEKIKITNEYTNIFLLNILNEYRDNIEDIIKIITEKKIILLKRLIFKVIIRCNNINKYYNTISIFLIILIYNDKVYEYIKNTKIRYIDYIINGKGFEILNYIYPFYKIL